MKSWRPTPIDFPGPRPSRLINMMPFVFGRRDSVPENLLGYWPIISRCDLPVGRVAYLTVHESWVARGQTQRRSGVHTDGTSAGGWGGGSWGGPKGIYLASTDGSCRVWDRETWDVDRLGALRAYPEGKSMVLVPNTLYRISDRIPHESLPAERNGVRQFVRVVGENIYGWWAEHSTPNPLGVRPTAPVLRGNKFEAINDSL